MKTIDELTNDLFQTANEIMYEPPAQPTAAALNARADRLEISMRCLICCSVLKELSFQELKDFLGQYGPQKLDSAAARADNSPHE